MKKDLLTIFSLTVIGLLFLSPLKAQTDTLYYINSSFETTEDQAKWTSLPTHATVKWDYDYGGHNYPISPKSGDYNAIFYWSDYGVSYYRTLTSIPIDLSSAERPELTFWHAQAEFIGQDELKILFKAGPTANWDTIDYFPNEIVDWTREVYNVHEVDEKYLCEGFQLGFLGLANGGQGVCLDSVVLKETAIIDKFVKSFDYEDVDHSLVGTKTKQLPILRVRIEVLGNNGNSDLNSISFQLNSGDDSYFKSNGFRLFHTSGNIYKTKENSVSTEIGSAVSISGGVVTFTGLSEELELGNNYIWLTADLADDLPHLSSFSFGVAAQSLSAVDTLLPSSAISNICQITAQEAVFYDNFDVATGWTLENDFEIDVPQGKIIGKSKDPGYAYSGVNVLGTDLTGDGAYPYGITVPYHATSPMIDLHYYDQVKVYMRKWIDFDPLDRASISFSTNNGGSWTTVWQSQIDNPTASSEWDEILFDEEADELLSKNDSVRIRFSVLETNTPSVRAGFNLDNFTVTGNYLDNDVGITRIISPFDDCLGFNNDTVKVVVRNYAAEPTPAEIPVYFGLWGPDSTLVHETITGSIAVDDSITYTFTNLANFPQGDIYDQFIVGVDLPGDEDYRNDTLIKPLIIPDSYTTPATIDFEYKGGVWTPSEGSTWLCKVPDGSIPSLPESPNAWILSPYGDYRNNDTSWVESNCFDLTLDKRNIVELDYWLISEAAKDGFAVEYSTNDGQSWSLVNNTTYGVGWGWYTSAVSALGHNGWSGISDGWETAKELLPEALNTEVKVQFRIKWAADGANNGRGLAFDNFKVFPAPPDVGVSTIEAPYDACQYENAEELSLWVKNYGFNDLQTNDTLILGYNFESDPAVIDTFLLSSDLLPGDSVQYILPVNFDIESAGTYEITAYTLIEDDPWFYGDNNDTLQHQFEIWQNPITGLEDTIQSRQPDTLIIQANIEPEYSYLWDFDGTSSTDSYYDVQEPGVYYLTVTESVHGCQTFDSVYIELLFADVGIDSIIWPQSSCELTGAEPVQIQIRNLGTDSLIVDDKILIGYVFNGGLPVKDSITLEQALHSGDALWFTFDGTEDLSAEGDYLLKAYSDYGGDTIPENDTLIRTISVWGYPDLNLGNDTVINGIDYLLEVDPSFDTYLWNDSVTTGTRLIDTSGVYWLDVVDIHGCPASDTIDIWFRIRDVRPVGLLSPTSSCERSGSEPVIMQFINSGSDTLSVLDTVAISYTFEGGTRYSEIVTNNSMLPGETYDHNFGTMVDLTALGAYDFELTAVTRNDMRTENDTLQPVILTDIAPIIDLGVDDEEIYKVTEMILDAGYGENYVYLWHDGSTEQTFTVTDIMEVWVVVTDTHTTCSGGDTALVYLDILDYMITNVDLDAQTCSGTYDDVDVSILNNGNLPRQGAEITLDFYMDSELLFTEYFENIGSWPAGATRTHTTSNSFDLEDTGNKNLEIQIATDGDLRTENDDYSKDLEVIPSPDVDFGGAQLEVDFPYTLDAGSGHASYLWSDGSTQSTLTVTEAGTYTVTVTGTNGCQTVRSVYVDTDLLVSKLAEENMRVDIYPNPASDQITIDVEFAEPGTYILEIFNSQNILFLNRKITELEYKEEFSLGNLPPGLYFIRIRDDRMYHVSKMIIN